MKGIYKKFISILITMSMLLSFYPLNIQAAGLSNQEDSHSNSIELTSDEDTIASEEMNSANKNSEQEIIEEDIMPAETSTKRTEQTVELPSQDLSQETSETITTEENGEKITIEESSDSEVFSSEKQMTLENSEESISEDLILDETIRNYLAAPNSSIKSNSSAAKYFVWQGYSGRKIPSKANNVNIRSTFNVIKKEITQMDNGKYNFVPHVSKDANAKMVIDTNLTKVSNPPGEVGVSHAKNHCYEWKSGGSLSCLYEKTGIWRESSTTAHIVDTKVIIEGVATKANGNGSDHAYIAFRDDLIGVAVRGVDGVRIRYEFYDHKTGIRIYPAGYVQFWDIDAQQGIALSDNAWNTPYFKDYSGEDEYLRVSFPSSDNIKIYVFAWSQNTYATANYKTRFVAPFDSSTGNMKTIYTFCKTERGEEFTYNGKNYSTSYKADDTTGTYLSIPAKQLKDLTDDTDVSYNNAYSQGLLGLTSAFSELGQPTISKSIYPYDKSSIENYKNKPESTFAETTKNSQVLYRVRTYIPFEYIETYKDGNTSFGIIPKKIAISDKIADTYTVTDSQIWGTNADAQYVNLTTFFNVSSQKEDDMNIITYTLKDEYLSNEWIYNNVFDLYYIAQDNSSNERFSTMYRSNNTMTYNGTNYIPIGGNVESKFGVGNLAYLTYDSDSNVLFSNYTTHAMNRTGNVTVQKVYEDNNTKEIKPLQGAKIQLWSWNHNQYEKVENNGIQTSGTDGYIKFDNLVYNRTNLGNYLITEAEAPQGFQKDTGWAYTFNIMSGDWTKYTDAKITDQAEITLQDLGTASTSGTNELTLNTDNMEFDAGQLLNFSQIQEKAVKVIKISQETGERLSGAEFTLYIWDSISNQYKEVEILTEEEDEQGSYRNIKPLQYEPSSLGKYKIVETKAPDGTINEGWEEEFVWDGKKSSEEIFSAIVENPIPMGILHIVKSDSETKESMSGITFKVTAAEDIRTKWGKILLEKGTEAGTIVTDKNGDGWLKDLYLGQYIIDEVATDDKHHLLKQPITVSFSYPENDKISEVEETIYIDNEPVHPSLSISKIADRTTGVEYNKDTGRYEGTKINGIYLPNQVITYTIKAYNNGDVSLSNVILKDEMSETLQKYIEKESASFVITSNMKTDKGKKVNITAIKPTEIVLDELGKGDTFTVNFTVNVKSNYQYFDTDILDNIIKATATYKTITLTPPDDYDRILLENPKPEIAVAKLASKTEGVTFEDKIGKYVGKKTYATYKQNDWVTYKITVTNTGNVKLENIMLTDIVSDELKEQIDMDTAIFEIPKKGSVKSNLKNIIKVISKNNSNIIIDHLESGESVSVNFKLRIKSDVKTAQNLKNAINAVTYYNDSKIEATDNDMINTQSSKIEQKIANKHVAKTGDFITIVISILFLVAGITFFMLLRKKHQNNLSK